MKKFEGDQTNNVLAMFLPANLSMARGYADIYVRLTGDVDTARVMREAVEMMLANFNQLQSSPRLPGPEPAEGDVIVRPWKKGRKP